MKKLLATASYDYDGYTSAVKHLHSHPSSGKGGTAFWVIQLWLNLIKNLRSMVNIVPRYVDGLRGKKSLKTYAQEGVNDPTVMVIALWR